MSTSIAGQREQQFFRQQELVSGICNLLTSKGEANAIIARTMQMTGEFLGLCRVLLLSYREPLFYCQYEWCTQNEPTSSKLDGVLTFTDAEAQAARALARRDIAWYYLYEADKADVMSHYGLEASACLFLPVFCEDSFWGLLEFDQCGGYTPWSAPVISLGETVAALLSLGIHCREREEYLRRTINEAQQSATQASQAKADFLSRMSHEMRTPLNAIIGMTDIALSSKDIDKREYCLNQIDSASKHLMNLINDILDMSKIESRQFTLSEDEFDFEQALIDIIEVVHFAAEEKRQDLVINIDPNVPRSLIGDELRIGQVINNLLTNAIKFTPEGGVIKLNVCQIAAEGDLLTLQLAVADNGIGISEAQQARLFTSFEQADGGMARQYGGSGLGLAICKYIVNLMGGNILVQSAINHGSTFTFTMKVKKGHRQLERKLASSISRSEIRILAIDDSADVREYFLHIMSALDLPCDVAASGAEALAMIAASDNKPYNLFFVDWLMPEMDGVELTKKIRDLTGYATLIIMISGSPWSEMEQEAVAAGVSHFIPKPLFSSSIINVINECLGVAAKDRVAAKKAVQEGGYNFHNHHLLLAEDVSANREIIHILLADTQIGIDNAANGRQAVEMFKKNPGKYSIILMDINMPEMDGYEAIRIIRALPGKKGKKIPIIAMTADVSSDTSEKCLSAGVNGYIGKPVGIKRLLEIMAEYLQSAATLSPAAKKEDSYKPISYVREDAPAANYSDFLPLIDVTDGLCRVMNNRTLYFTLLHNFSGRALAGEMITHIRNNDYAQTAQKAHALKGVAANLGLNELLTIIDDITEHAKMEVSSISLISKLEETLDATLNSIKLLLEGEGII